MKVIACHSSNKQFPSSKNEPKCKTFVVEMIYQIFSMRIKKYIFISIASHLPSLGNRGFFKGGGGCANCKCSIHHFHIDYNAPCLPPKFCITIVLDFFWNDCNTQEKCETMVMQFFFFLGGGGGVNEVHYGLCESSE